MINLIISDKQEIRNNKKYIILTKQWQYNLNYQCIYIPKNNVQAIWESELGFVGLCSYHIRDMRENLLND